MYYIQKSSKYEKQKSIFIEETRNKNSLSYIQSCFTTAKNWLSYVQDPTTENSQKKLTSEILEKKLCKLLNYSNLEKTIISMFGVTRFNQIPLFKDCLQSELSLPTNLTELISLHILDPIYPSIVRGKTDHGINFIFFYPKYKDETNKVNGYYHMSIFLDEDSAFDTSKPMYIITSAFPNSNVNGNDISNRSVSKSTIQIIHDLISTGSSNHWNLHSNGSALQLDFSNLSFSHNKDFTEQTHYKNSLGEFLSERKGS